MQLCRIKTHSKRCLCGVSPGFREPDSGGGASAVSVLAFEKPPVPKTTHPLLLLSEVDK